MSRPEQTPPLLSAPLPESLQAWLRHLAIQRAQAATPQGKARTLWSCSFTLPGMGNDVSLELLGTLVLRIRNRVTGEVFMQTEPVQFGALASDEKTLAERFERWCLERRASTDGTTQPEPAADAAAPAAASEDTADGQKPPAEGEAS